MYVVVYTNSIPLYQVYGMIYTHCVSNKAVCICLPSTATHRKARWFAGLSAKWTAGLSAHWTAGLSAHWTAGLSAGLS